MSDPVGRQLAELLFERGAKIVLAESCTGGLAAATLTETPGISNHLCGSAVVYRPSVKQDWLGVPEELMLQHTTESQPVADALALGVLQRTSEAEWAAAVVGHLDERARIWLAIAQRSATGPQLRRRRQVRLLAGDRVGRQREAADRLLAALLAELRADA